MRCVTHTNKTKKGTKCMEKEASKITSLSKKSTCSRGGGGGDGAETDGVNVGPRL